MLLRRLMMMVMLFCFLTMIGTVIMGSLVPSVILTGYQENEGQLHTTYVEDGPRGIRIKLTGTRCFEALPPWVYSDGNDAPYFFRHGYWTFLRTCG